MTQATLPFGEILGGKHRAAFEVFHALNPHVFAAFQRLALETFVPSLNSRQPSRGTR